jgi:hypothetical protein
MSALASHDTVYSRILPTYSPNFHARVSVPEAATRAA